MKDLKLLVKVLLTVLLCGAAWFLEWESMMMMNMPNTALVTSGFAAIVMVIWLWWMAMNRLWELSRHFKTLYDKVKKEIA